MDRENIFINEYNIGSNGASEQMHKYFTPIWDNSVDQSGPFESSLTSMVSSPTSSNPPPPPGGCTNDNIVLRELIGRLGSIYNPGEVSPHSYMNLNNSANTSCYSTPLNSPPKLNLSMVDHQIRGNSTTLPFHGSHFPAQSSLTQLTNDPGFAERAAKYSCFADKNMENGQENQDGDQNSSVSEEKNPGGEVGLNGQNDMNSRKRKSSSKGKGKDALSTKEANDGLENNELSAKRSKTEESENENEKDGKSKVEENGNDNYGASGNKKEGKGNQKPSEPPKDYIHVRARRGQATDAHSLAERVRREKISQKMKHLQDLVPGCNKVTGKAVMLDEIINYVQSLQRQVEFLSMKLATIDPRLDVNLEGLLPKEMFQSCESVPNSNYALNNSAAAYPFPFQSQQVPNLHINAVLGPNMQLPPVEINKANRNSQGGTFFEDDLQSMIFGQNQAHNFHGVMPTGQMKVEL